MNEHEFINDLYKLAEKHGLIIRDKIIREQTGMQTNECATRVFNDGGYRRAEIRTLASEEVEFRVTFKLNSEYFCNDSKITKFP
jgi:hypothetical protein